ncbi:predicted protein [Phaeodactylum tricornutum CCAP 1055/1]|jgi:hypothetical protein|uniref:Uncharacterized protein n=2 Tax=Phaeodactylum tricornutum TaxID=2850 RepID=B7G6Y6_PHATC|nr:predicted protein [Phaeodactylum tricornutum CCAP 1055/1]EEC45675.1 predicted protein [Phaeodactylum tricornutum CCAP 1055/1]|eukprot:XP_002182939.1 predicted protein [Phaeodactylum tricornutum CCAP 1055/1]
MRNGDAIAEDDLILCCALCCANLSILSGCECLGCSGKAGICCFNLECCFKPGAPCLTPLCCLGIKCENDGHSLLNAQCHALMLVFSCAVPCNEEVPVAVSIAGLTLYPKCGFCIKQRALKTPMVR